MDGAKVLIDSAVLERVDATQPPYLSRTSWVNHLLDCAVTPPHVDQYTIEAVKENVDILKIISEEVEPVEEGNARYIGTCPIHESEATTPWANARAAATFLAVSERTLARWRSSGLLKSGDHYRRKFPAS